MAGEQTKNDKAWESLFANRDIVQDVDRQGFHQITASAINQYREARLMTKFDHKVNLPKVFDDNGLAILPDSRSSYVIGRFQCYANIPKFDNSEEIIDRSFPEDIETISWENLYSESAALLCAQHAGLIKDVLDEDFSALTVFGRMSTGTFDFSIRALNKDKSSMKQLLSVDRAQCEIDGGFEGAKAFAIVEVKNDVVDDFHIRQLYFPYRLWSGKIGKPIIPIFLTYTNEIFSFYVYEFIEKDNYNSINLLKKRRYQIVPTEIEVSAIRDRLAKTKNSLRNEPLDAPFPQADSFVRVINLLTRLHTAKGILTQEEITTDYAFDIRQTQYYTQAGTYLGLINRAVDDERRICYTLTQIGSQLMNMAPRKRNLALIEIVLSYRVFHWAMEDYLSNSQIPSKEKIVGFMGKANLGLNETTKHRRAQTVIGWIRWMMDLSSDA